MATVSNIKQIVNSSSITPSLIGTSNIKEMNYPQNYDGDRIQQIIIKNNFLENNCYWIRIGIPQDIIYDLNYGIRLMNIDNEVTEKNLNDVSDYQFIKYISIPKYQVSTGDNSIIWHYQHKTTAAINAAVAVQVANIASINNIEVYNRANKIFYTKNNNNIIDHIYRCDHQGNIIQNNNENEDLINKINYKPITLTNNFASDQNTGEYKKFQEFLICPNKTYNTIYLYLKPIVDDSNMIWYKKINNQDIQMIGRHVDISNISVSYANITSTNIISAIGNNATINNIAIWGRSEQLIALNGQELSIGPSGYYELKDFKINSLYIANIATDDKYTVDVQYTTNN